MMSVEGTLSSFVIVGIFAFYVMISVFLWSMSDAMSGEKPMTSVVLKIISILVIGVVFPGTVYSCYRIGWISFSISTNITVCNLTAVKG